MKHEEAIEMLMAERYVLGELPGTQREEFEEHMFSCAHCAQDVRDLDLVCRGAAVLGPSLPSAAEAAQADSFWARFAQSKLAQWWARPQIGAAAAVAMLAMTVTLGLQWNRESGAGNRNLNSFPGGPIASYMLLPETRGAAAPFSAGSGSPLVLLEADLPGAQGQLSYKLTNAEGQTLVEGTAESPVPGATWKLLVPASLLGASHYRLQVTVLSSSQSFSFAFQAKKN
ncbi:zf-HC2 domain-containing protein [Oscillatoria amoena NRMC-F 0135]|nr:zf-HC2 domain-containing protein [Oscillatoria amoena NRMC-F 0135]